MKNIICIFSLLIVSVHSFSQKAVFDSLYHEASNAKTNYDKAFLYDEASRAILRYNPDSALLIANLGLEYAEKSNNDTLIADSYNSLGVVYRTISQYEEAIQSLKSAITHAKKVNALRQIETAKSALGLIYTEQGNYSAAIEIYYEILLGAKKRNDTSSIAHVSNNLGNIYFEQNLYNKALENYKEAYIYAVAMNSEFGQCLLLGNIGSVYYKKEMYDSAMINYQKSYDISVKIEDQEGVGISLGNFASVFFNKKKFQKALTYQEKALEIKKQLNDKHGESVSLNEIGKIHHEMGNVNRGILFSKDALKIATLIGAKELERDAFEALYKMYDDKGNKPLAYSHFKKHIELRDSLINEDSKIKDIRNELNFNYQKQHFADSLEQIKKDEIAQQNIEKEKIKANAQKKLTYVFSIAFFIMIVLSGFIYKEYKAKKLSNIIINKQKEEVEKAHNELTQKNKEITDSITYAKRIQEAILPSRYSLTENLKNGFVLYKPKDIVSGDFYWLEKHEDSIFFAAADCTGHGVPGAMVSVMCSNALSKSLLEENIIEPSKILDRTRELVLQRFEKSDENVKDGMDISLCNIQYSKDATNLQWAGANNPLWIVRNNKLIEFKGDKQPIGKVDNPMPFTNHTITLQKNDTIYIFTDGFPDQFGGPKGKKFMYKPFKELLLSIQDKNMEEQKGVLNQAFEDWKGNLEQVDDICVIGVRI